MGDKLLKVAIKTALTAAFLFVVAVSPAGAHGAEAETPNSPFESGSSIDERISDISTKSTAIATIIVLLLLIISAVLKNETEWQKTFLFGGIAAAVLVNTVIIIGLTIYLNAISYTKGPVHWHAAFEFYGCGERIELVDPRGFTNRVGSPTLHEHNDNWIHLEGVPITPSDATLGNFLSKIGVSLSEDELSVPIEPNGVIHLDSGDSCDGEPGLPQVFVYKFTKINGKYSYVQEKFASIEKALEYVMKPTGNIPPGDCLIVEFDSLKARTDKLCAVYEAARARGELIEAGHDV